MCTVLQLGQLIISLYKLLYSDSSPASSVFQQGITGRQMRYIHNVPQIQCLLLSFHVVYLKSSVLTVVKCVLKATCPIPVHRHDRRWCTHTINTRRIPQHYIYTTPLYSTPFSLFTICFKWLYYKYYITCVTKLIKYVSAFSSPLT